MMILFLSTRELILTDSNSLLAAVTLSSCRSNQRHTLPEFTSIPNKP